MSTEIKSSNRHGGRNALVIGGTRDFGLAVTDAVCRAGYSVFTVGRSSKPVNASEHFICDVMDQSAWEKTVEAIKERLSGQKIDLIIYIVGYARVHPFHGTPLIEWHRHLWLNFTYVASSFPSFERLLSDTARIGTVGSQWSHQKGWPDLVPYISAKHTLASYTEEMALAFPNLIFRHFCVPTMKTAGYAKVLDSISENDASKCSKIFPSQLADPVEIGKSLVNSILYSNPSSRTLLRLGPDGKVAGENGSQTNV